MTSALIRSRQDETARRVEPKIGEYLDDALFDAAGPYIASGSAEIVEPARLVHAVAGRAWGARWDFKTLLAPGNGA